MVNKSIFCTFFFHPRKQFVIALLYAPPNQLEIHLWTLVCGHARTHFSAPCSWRFKKLFFLIYFNIYIFLMVVLHAQLNGSWRLKKKVNCVSMFILLIYILVVLHGCIACSTQWLLLTIWSSPCELKSL